MFVVDSTVMIDLHRHFESASVRRALHRLARQDKLKIPEGVQREIARRTDAAHNTLQWVTQRRPACIVSLSDSPGLPAELARVERLYGDRIRVGKQEYLGFWKSASGRKSADGQVVAVAKVLGGRVVSDDKAIQRACLCENIPCIGWTEFARTLVLSRQLGLFE